LFPHETTLNLYTALLNLTIQNLQLQSMTTLHSLGKKRALKRLIKETATYGSTGTSSEQQRRIEQMLIEKFNVEEDPENEAQLIQQLLKKTGKQSKDEELIMRSSQSDLDVF